MKTVRALILRTAGTNCDMETSFAFSQAGAMIELVHINRLIREKNLLKKYHILAIPGGFTYGDDIASGKILANELKFSLKNELARFIKDGKLIIGICNGFQVLVKMGLLPGVDRSQKSEVRGQKYRGFTIEATLSLNDSGKFEDRWVYLQKAEGRRQKSEVRGQKSEVRGQRSEVRSQKSEVRGQKSEVRSQKSDLCVWTRGLPEIIYLPVAHGEGKFIPRDEKVLEDLRENGQIVFRYVDKDGNIAGYPENPNGSIDNIAGVCDPTGRIFGMMPHPERHITYLQHPNWRRVSVSERNKMGIGLRIFENGIRFAQSNL